MNVKVVSLYAEFLCLDWKAIIPYTTGSQVCDGFRTYNWSGSPGK